MKLLSLVVASTQVKASPMEGSCEPQDGWNCMDPHHKHGAVCFQQCHHGSSGHHQDNAYKECHCKSHHNCEWIQLSHCHHPHPTEEAKLESPQSEAQVKQPNEEDTLAAAIESLFGDGTVVEMPQPEQEHHHKKHHKNKHHQMANDAIVTELEEAEEEPEEPEEQEEEEQEELEVVATTAEPTTAEPTTTTTTPEPVSMTNCHKPHHHWECDGQGYVDGVTCKRECVSGAGYGYGHHQHHQQSCSCGEHGCFWIVTSDCRHFHRDIYHAEEAHSLAKGGMTCDRNTDPEWNCSHDYIHIPGTICVKACDEALGLSEDFHAVSECQCKADDCAWAALSSC